MEKTFIDLLNKKGMVLTIKDSKRINLALDFMHVISRDDDMATVQIDGRLYYISKSGHIYAYDRNHRDCYEICTTPNKHGYYYFHNICKHRLVAYAWGMFGKGRYSKYGDFDVHHIDGDKSNNDITNLQIMTREDHKELHKALNVYKKLVEKYGINI